MQAPLLACIPSSSNCLRGAGLCISAALRTRVARITISTLYCHQLSKTLKDSFRELADNVMTLQNQINSLAGVVLQNRQAPDLLTAEKGGTCLFLQEECFFCVNQSGFVQGCAAVQ
jgi:hypothetical protein